MSGYDREVAYRVFAGEIARTNIVLEKDTSNQFAPQYVMTPTGARVNRVCMIGTLTDIDDIGQEQEYWRARLVDPTGAISVYAGQYKPEAARTLATAEIPDILAIIGKVNPYTSDEGQVTVSIRPESVAVVSEVSRDRWIFATAQQTANRIRALEAASPDSISDMHYYRDMVGSAAAGLIA